MKYAKTSRSPYHKYNKRPYIPSPAYQRWREAVTAYGLHSPEVAEADVAFRRLNDIPMRRETA